MQSEQNGGNPNMRKERMTMPKRGILFSALLMVLVLAGCGPRTGGGELSANTAPDELVVDLPALYIDVDTTGNLSVAGTSLTEMAALVGQDLSTLKLDPVWVQYLTATNIQHIQINNTPEGIVILANGEPVPSLGWGGDALLATTETMDTLGAQINPMIGKIVPIIRNMGVGIVIRIPVAEGTPLIPLRVEGDDSAAAQAKEAQEAFLAAVGSPPQIRVTVAYAPDGTFQIAGLSGSDLAQLGLPLQALTLPRATVQQLSGMGIQSIGFATNPQGIFISVNNRTLPHITWGEGEVNHVLKLAAQMGFLQQVVGSSENTEALVRTIESFLPIVQASDVSLTFTFQ
jgi:hypothetical protein